MNPSNWPTYQPDVAALVFDVWLRACDQSGVVFD